MSSKDRNTISSSLQKKGFVLTSGDHKYFTYHSTNKKKTCVFTKISHSPKHKTIGDNLLTQMSKQCRLTKADFLDLIECPLTRDSYEAKLLNQGIKLN
jgi:predicted transcriptional regulator